MSNFVCRDGMKVIFHSYSRYQPVWLQGKKSSKFVGTIVMVKWRSQKSKAKDVRNDKSCPALNHLSHGLRIYHTEQQNFCEV